MKRKSLVAIMVFSMMISMVAEEKGSSALGVGGLFYLNI